MTKCYIYGFHGNAILNYSISFSKTHEIDKSVNTASFLVTISGDIVFGKFKKKINKQIDLCE